MTHNTDEERRRMAAAVRYIDDPNSDPFTTEGLDHMDVFLEDMARRAKAASIIAGKSLTQESVGEEASFDFYHRGQSTLQYAIRAQSLGSIIRALIEQKADGISLDDLKLIYAEVLLETAQKQKDLNDFGSSITHLVTKTVEKRWGKKP